MTVNMIQLPIQPPIYPDTASLPPDVTPGSEAIVLTSPPSIYIYDGTSWILTGGGGTTSVTSVTGTANQVIASPTTGDVVLSLPQDIATFSTPTFSSIRLTTGATLNYVWTCSNAGTGAGGWSVVPQLGITALTGDVTATGPGSAVATISSNAVTFSKFQQIAATSLVGNSTGSLGNVQTISIGNSLAFTGTTLNTIQDITTSSNVTFAGVTASTSFTFVTGASTGYVLTSSNSGGVSQWTNLATIAVTQVSGVANRITVTSNVGSVQISTPQDIATSSAVQFGSLGLGSSLVTSSILSLTSTTLGFLLPRMTTTQRDAITSPATGLAIFNTTTVDIEYYTGSVWIGVITSGVTSATGTANQVLINGVTTPQTGSATFTLPQSIATSSAVQFGTLGLGSSLVTSAILSLTSTTLGFLPPVMTTSQRNGISSPATGLQIYNSTTGNMEVYNGSGWVGLITTSVTSITGTTAQVLANGTVGTPQTGAVTLTLPQNIDTTSGPQFASVRINTSNNLNKLDVFGNAVIGGSAGLVTAPTNGLLVGGITGLGTNTPDSNTQVEILCSNAINLKITGLKVSIVGGQQFGLFIAPILAGVATSLFGEWSDITYSVSLGNTVTNAYNKYLRNTVSSVAGTITNAFGLYIEAGSVAGSGSITNSTNLYVDAPSMGTNKTALGAANLAVGYTGINMVSNSAIIAGSVSIGSSSLTSSAILALTSTSQGFLPTTLTLSQRNAISSPATGLMIYNTTNSDIEFYTGSTWKGTQTSGVTSITGTANQVLANGSTSPQVGAVTLTLPQSIATSSTPQFAGLGLGAAASSTIGLNLSAQTTHALAQKITGTMNADDGTETVGLYMDVTISPSSNNKSAYGIYLIQNFNPNGTNTITLAASLSAIAQGTVGSGAVTTAMSGRFLNPTIGTNKIALYADNQSIGFTTTTPPSNGMIVSGQSIFGSTGAVLTNSKLEVINGFFSIQNIAGAVLPASSGRLCAVIGTNYAANGETNFYSTYSNPFLTSSRVFDFRGFDGSATPNLLFSIYGNGGISIGTSYSATLPPANGIIVSGIVGIGKNSPAQGIDMVGSILTQNSGAAAYDARFRSASGNNSITIQAGGVFGTSDVFSTGSLILGSQASSANLTVLTLDNNGNIITSHIASTSGSQLSNSYPFFFQGGYWNGSVDIGYSYNIRTVIDSTTPSAHISFQNNSGVEFLQLSMPATAVGSFTKLIGYGANTTNPVHIIEGARGTAGSPTAIQSGDYYGAYSFSGYGASTFVGNAALFAKATENFSNTAVGTQLELTATANGSSTGSTRLIVNYLYTQLNASSLFLAYGSDIASASLIQAVGGNTFTITGTTSINCLDDTNWTNGSTVTFFFAAASCSIIQGGSITGAGKVFNMSGGSTYTSAANSRISFMKRTVSGTVRWYEVSRSSY